jgi:hypothetical protein
MAQDTETDTGDIQIRPFADWLREQARGATHDEIVVSDAIKLKLPEHDRPAALYFVDKSGNAVREDPNQPAFESLREVGVDGKRVNTATGEIDEKSS